MFTRNDLLDALRRHLDPGQTDARRPSRDRSPVTAASSNYPELQGKRFLTERDIRQALTPAAKVLTIPTDAIVSPLAQDWLALKEIRIIRSSP